MEEQVLDVAAGQQGASAITEGNNNESLMTRTHGSRFTELLSEADSPTFEQLFAFSVFDSTAELVEAYRRSLPPTPNTLRAGSAPLPLPIATPQPFLEPAARLSSSLNVDPQYLRPELTHRPHSASAIVATTVASRPASPFRDALRIRTSFDVPFTVSDRGDRLVVVHERKLKKKRRPASASQAPTPLYTESLYSEPGVTSPISPSPSTSTTQLLPLPSKRRSWRHSLSSPSSPSLESSSYPRAPSPLRQFSSSRHAAPPASTSDKPDRRKPRQRGSESSSDEYMGDVEEAKRPNSSWVSALTGKLGLSGRRQSIRRPNSDQSPHRAHDEADVEFSGSPSFEVLRQRPMIDRSQSDIVSGGGDMDTKSLSESLSVPASFSAPDLALGNIEEEPIVTRLFPEEDGEAVSVAGSKSAAPSLAESDSHSPTTTTTVTPKQSQSPLELTQIFADASCSSRTTSLLSASRPDTTGTSPLDLSSSQDFSTIDEVRKGLDASSSDDERARPCSAPPYCGFLAPSTSSIFEGPIPVTPKLSPNPQRFPRGRRSRSFTDASASASEEWSFESTTSEGDGDDTPASSATELDDDDVWASPVLPKVDGLLTAKSAVELLPDAGALLASIK